MLVMLDFLNEIRATGKITRAAERADVSYRHAWNLIGKWSQFFGTPLVERHQGRGTVLTNCGERLVWAGQRMQARLGPQLQNLEQELESEINALLPDSGAAVRIHASHGFAVSALRDLLAGEPALRVDFRYVGKVDAPRSLARGECELAGMHLPQGSLREHGMAAWRDVLSTTDHCVIRFVKREMGLIVRKGNPRGIGSLRDLLRPEPGLPAVRVHACRGGGLCGQRHGRCQFRGGGGGTAVPAGLRARGHRGGYAVTDSGEVRTIAEEFGVAG